MTLDPLEISRLNIFGLGWTPPPPEKIPGSAPPYIVVSCRPVAPGLEKIRMDDL